MTNIQRGNVAVQRKQNDSPAQKILSLTDWNKKTGTDTAFGALKRSNICF